ncbi:putative mitochondrial ATP-dependent RNA helicase Suv3 [Aspergillus steynii IBT 23096]|uniref:RNA helicase n=1 Tax=Aspergillus steynii IBT 23096 TaxID=1392250 RepID=A0A2I2G7Z8_9EURO|nr:putative mitochondrial ATP-dependent RNA helicase Suv3 [Aspergillus steynii IBT 23096]PLB49006.1 putative mitochondrial ATP-dependent RNA helicase Suv3 [Aspergillus steynii IBT 23096]
MQAWRTRGKHCLFCSYQALLRPVTRTFATTPTLQRSGGSSKKAKQSKKAITPVKPSALREPVKKWDRQQITAPDFAGIVQALLLEYRQKFPVESEAGLKKWQRFERYVLNACKVEQKGRAAVGPLRQLKLTLQKAYIKDGVRGLKTELDYVLYAEELTSKYSAPNLRQQQSAADMRYPAEWYPQARAMRRTIHLHVGPTNSGKTYNALKRLRETKSGFYAGPLRLLAQEVYYRFKASGTSCSLVTGDDVKVPDDHVAAVICNTVEMVDIAESFEVGVIDEIQMLADPQRGWAWTRALLGSRATELHLCGETRVVPLIRDIAALTGDKLEIHHYERLNPLKVSSKSLEGNLQNLEKGDCVVAFSRVGIHALKSDIEKATGRRAAIVYGSLPAEIRIQQAGLFNDPDNEYDFLVASDAIGMGLNLSCKRVIFETLVKRTPNGLQRLTVPEIKQIGGRAGRYRSAGQTKSSETDEPNVGLVTCLEEIDLPFIQAAMSTEPPPLTAAGIFPPDVVFHKLGAYFPPNVPLEYIIKRTMELSKNSPLFFLCNPRGQLENAEIIDTVSGLRLEDQLTFMAAPLTTRDQQSRDVSRALAECVANHTNGHLLDIHEFGLEILEEPVSGSKQYLHGLEVLHKALISYMWLSFRFGGVFTDRTLAGHVKELVEERMIRALTEFSANKKLRRDASLRRQIALQKQIEEHQRLLSDADYRSEDQQPLPVDLSAENSSSTEASPEANAM